MYRCVAFLMLMVGTGLSALGLRISRGRVEVTGAAAPSVKGDAGGYVVNPIMLVDPSKV